MLTKNTYILVACLGLGAAALLILMIITPTNEQIDPHQSEPVMISSSSAEADSAMLAAIQQGLQSIQTVLPQLKTSLQSNQIANEKRIALLEQDIRDLKLAITSSEDIPKPQVDSQIPSDAEQPPYSILREHEQAKQRAQAQVVAFDHALNAEVRDEGWASEMENQIALASQNELYQGSTIGTASCKSTFCRFEAFHDGMDTRDNFELIRRELPNSYHMQNFDLGDGSSKTVMYVIREGEEFNNIIFSTLNESL